MTDYIELSSRFDKTPHQIDDTEDSLALSFCEMHPELRHVALWGKWLNWTGSVWKRDETFQIFDLIRKHVRATTDSKQAKKASTVAAIEKLVKSDRRYAATFDQWDADPWLLNTPGAVVDLRDGTLRKHDPLDYITKSTSVTPRDICPIWMRFLEDVTAGDRAYITFLQRVIGYAATGSTREHALFFEYGPGGNGKGVFLNTIQAVMGDYATVASMEAFTESKSDRHPTDLAMLQGARLVFAQETESGKAWAEARIKALTGGDPVTARYMRQDFFTFEPKFKLLIAGNHKPRLRNVDDAMKRRFHLLPFTQTFGADIRDPDLTEKLKSEHPGILQWIIDGAVAYYRDGLDPPPVVCEATAEYFQSEDLFDQWLNDCCEVETDFWDRPATLFNNWKDYAKAANEDPGNQKTFNECMERHGFTRGKDGARGGRYWRGLKLRPSDFVV